MAVTWNINSTSGLGSGYKDKVKNMANSHGYGSLYEATRNNDYGGNHCWACKTKKYLGLKKYRFTVYTRKDSVYGTEEGAGYGPDVKEI